MLIVHADDFVDCGTATIGSHVIEAIKIVSKTSREYDGMFHYIGLEIKHGGHGIVMEQNAYSECHLSL